MGLLQHRILLPSPLLSLDEACTGDAAGVEVALALAKHGHTQGINPRVPGSDGSAAAHTPLDLEVLRVLSPGAQQHTPFGPHLPLLQCPGVQEAPLPSGRFLKAMPHTPPKVPPLPPRPNSGCVLLTISKGLPPTLRPATFLTLLCALLTPARPLLCRQR